MTPERFDTPFGQLELRYPNEDGHLDEGRVFRFALKCPGCGRWGEIDEDQIRGRVSVDHGADGCPGGYHETHNFAAHLPADVCEFYGYTATGGT